MEMEIFVNLQGTAKFDDMLNVSHFYEASKAVDEGQDAIEVRLYSIEYGSWRRRCATPLWPDFTGRSFCC